MSLHPTVYILILNWEKYADTIECIEACRKLNYPGFHILVVDNGSANSSEQILRERFPWLELLQSGKNLGYAGGNNVGIRHALALGADYVWILNPDVRVKVETLTELVQFAEDHPDVGLCGPRVLHGRMEGSFAFDGLSIDIDDGYQYSFNIAPSADKAECVDVDCVSGCSVLVRSGVFREIGLLREDFFLYYEDVEFCFRARAAQWRTVVFPGCRVRHAEDRVEQTDSISFYPERSRIILSRLLQKGKSPTFVTSHSKRILRAYIRNFQWIRAASGCLKLFLAALLGCLKPLGSTPKLVSDNEP